jgi:hypothetical protein
MFWNGSTASDGLSGSAITASTGTALVKEASRTAKA